MQRVSFAVQTDVLYFLFLQKKTIYMLTISFINVKQDYIYSMCQKIKKKSIKFLQCFLKNKN